MAAVNNNDVPTSYTTSKGTSTFVEFAPVFNNFTGMAANAVQFNWTDTNNPSGTRYRVLTSTVDNPSTFPTGAVVTSSYTYNLYLSSTNLKANTTYYFQAAAINNNDVPTSWTTSKGTSTLANQPGTLISTFSNVTSSGFTASWNANLNPPSVTIYTVMVSTDANFTASASPYQISFDTAPSGPSATFTGLLSFTEYYFRVRAVNHNGIYTDYVNLGSTKTLNLPAPNLGSITNVSTYSITGNWQLVIGATGYMLAASINPDNPPSPIYASSTTLGDISATIFNPALVPNTTYYLFVRSNGPGESSTWSAYPATSTWANEPLSVVSTFSAVTASSFFVHWDNNSNPLTTTLYTVHVSTAYDFNPGATDQVSFTTAPVSGPSAQFTALNSDTYYYFRVRAVHNNGGFTDWVNLGYVKTLAVPVLPEAGDGVIFYGQAGNTMPQFREYKSADNTFSGVKNTVSGTAGSLFVIKTSPISTKQEIMAGYVKDGTLRVLCSDGANWYEEWTQSVGGNETTRRFDIAYETNTGDVMVLYSQNQGTTNELGYRTKPGNTDCGSANWSVNTNLDPAGTSGVVQWVKMASDRRPSSGTLVAIWADASSDLSAMVWTGTGWENEPNPVLESSLEVVTAAQDVDDFDVEFESLSGDIMVVWANSAGANGTNGVRYATATWTGGNPLHSWGNVVTPATFLDDATDLDLAANPASNEMVFASIGNAGSDLQIGYWSGSAWTNTANVDTACQLPLAGTKLVAAGWLTSGGTTRWVVAYNDNAATNIGWYYGTTGTPTAGADAAPDPAFGNPQKIYNIHQDPVNKDRLILSVSDLNSDLFAKRLVMDSVPNFTWTDANSGVVLEANLSSTTVGGFSFAFWPSTPTPVFTQSAYRFFDNTDTADVGTVLAGQNTVASLPSAGAFFRLRTLLHIDYAQLSVSGQDFKLQFAGKGDGTCDAPSNGTPASYTDVTGATLIAFKDNSPLDNTALTGNANDPKHGAHTTVNQTYEELNNFTNSIAAVPVGQDGQWDFALKDNGMVPGTAYCLRIVKADGSILSYYEVYPEIILTAPVLINEVYPTGPDAASDRVELYNNTTSTPSIVGWKLNYIENTIDIGGTPNTVWTGQAGDIINAKSTFTITPSMNLNGAMSYHVKLLDNSGNLVDQVQWPGPSLLSQGQSFARVTDGNPSYFEIDPTSTTNYANHITTHPVKISEVSYGNLNGQFIEIYNTSSVDTLTLAGYAIRNSAASSNGLRFKFTRKIYPQNYTVIDFSSISNDGLSYTEVFGTQGLNAAGDFLALEDSAGSTIDEVTWESGESYSRYNYKAQKISFTNHAAANAANSIGRWSAEAYDTGNHSIDFLSTNFTTIGSTNNNAGNAAANTLTYPVNTSEAQFLARKFPITMTIGQASSSGGGDNIIFQRTGGNPDTRSPHIYRLSDIGFNLDTLTSQTTVRFFI
ncbi:MAG: lamin tail domain-containing protein [Elusimicrobia bacterium]|nr:lamin tail domain-containing protein [Elusimicrobiota bacterium]